MEKKMCSPYRWIRVVHRDIGFFVIGLTVIYCISGVMLTYRNTDFLKNEGMIEKTVEPGLAANQLGRALHIRELKVTSEDAREIRFDSGIYDKASGTATYMSKELPLLLRKFNGLHVVSGEDPRHWFTAIYASMLFFLAVSSFWMYRPGSRYFKRGIVTSVLGLGVAAVLVIL